MYTISMQQKRTEKDKEQCGRDRREAAKNPLVPGARILRGKDAVFGIDPFSFCRQWCYPLSEVNDLGFFSYMEKKKDTDAGSPWILQAHPGVNLYLYILSGEGKLFVGEEDENQESYAFGEEELVIVPRDVPYRMEGEWNAICFHARTGVYGTVAGNERFPHPVLIQKDGTLLYFNQVMSRFLPMGKREAPKKCETLQGTKEGQELMETYDINELYQDVTPLDPQTLTEENRREAGKHAQILGARVLKRTDAPAVYNANAGLKQSSYPLTWTDDIAICNLAEKLESSDLDRPFDSHSHPDIEEYKFILSGSGTVTIGVGDETCEEETYAFEAGDLVILPRGLAHLDAGGYTALYFHTKQSVFGKVPGDSLYPHIAYVYTRPKRPTREEEEALNDPGTYIKMNSRETYNVYCPNPILRVEKNPTDMTHLRPDLFDKEDLA